MNAYRGAPCEFCDERAAETCPRCQSLVCADHGLAGHAFCAMCRKERDDDLEVARFAEAVTEEPEDALTTNQGRAAESFVAALGRFIANVGKPHTRTKKFDERTPRDIAEWREAAGVRTRRRS